MTTVLDRMTLASTWPEVLPASGDAALAGVERIAHALLHENGRGPEVGALAERRGDAVRAISSGLTSGVRGLAQRLNPPVPIDLEPMPEDIFGRGWFPGANNAVED
ncbi:hypothetical protein CcI49_03150 [Frankia sp. CcI49]|uniref:hypothetical protein n=1 Tax=Frankia sp. CcI49 TaxID=1745382 RepID=UPI0009776BFA|nr:hypothetical protein [Frankia sp. CcI49]ONH62390.1 hypothetical protein CcI49_03150 [Frankia sp. CcI49]